MSLALSELCRSLQDNTDKLEGELKRNIANCHKLLIDKKATEVKLSLEKAKDYHYKEVLNILKDIVNNLRKIIFHEEKIRKLDNENNLSPDELKRYSYVQRQVQAFSNAGEEVTKREKRRVASEISVDSLEAWEMYLEKKEEDEKKIHIENITIAKRKSGNNRRKKKFVSSTFNNFLDGRNDNGGLHSISEEEQLSLTNTLAKIEIEDYNSDDETENLSDYYDTRLATPATSLGSIYESANEDVNSIDSSTEDLNQRNNLSTLDILESLNREYNLSKGKTKPKIVDVVFKKSEL